MWEKFGVISDEESNIVKGFAACKTCLKVFVFDSRKYGTSSLRKHAETCSNKPNTSSIEQYLSKGTELKVPRRDDKDTITRLSVNFVCNDIRPFDAVHGEGFFALAQGLIDVGARAGRVDVKQLLPDPTTVSRSVNKYAEEIRQKLIPELKMQLEGSNGAVTLDMWTDDYRKKTATFVLLCTTLTISGSLSNECCVPLSGTVHCVKRLTTLNQPSSAHCVNLALMNSTPNSCM